MLRPLVIVGQIGTVSQTLKELSQHAFISIPITLLPLLLIYLFILRVWLAFYDFKKREHLLDLKWTSHLQLNHFGVSVDNTNGTRDIYSGSNNIKNKNIKTRQNNHAAENGQSVNTGDDRPWTIKYENILGNSLCLILICVCYWLIFVVFACVSMIYNINDNFIFISVVLSCTPFILIGIFVTHGLRELKPDILEIKSEFSQICNVFAILVFFYIIIISIINSNAFNRSESNLAWINVISFVFCTLSLEIMCIIMVWRNDPGHSAYRKSNVIVIQSLKSVGSSKAPVTSVSPVSPLSPHTDICHIGTVSDGSKGSACANVNRNMDNETVSKNTEKNGESGLTRDKILSRVRTFTESLSHKNVRSRSPTLSPAAAMTTTNGKHMLHHSSSKESSIYTDIFMDQMEINRADSFMRNSKVSLKHLLNDKQGFKAFASHCVTEYSIENLLFLLEYMQVKQFLLQKKYVM